MKISYLCTILLSASISKSSAWSISSSNQRRASLTKVFSSNDSNVVLRPSDDPTAFDSFRIGTPRVHRYIRDSLSSIEDDSGEYVMWYHGRPSNFDESGELPPLSTGRIGRATSRNGLHWQRSLEGSESEDIGGVTLGLNKESWWGFDTAHVGLGQVMLPMSTPAVISEGGVYLMYYMGGSFEETPLSLYLDKDVELPQDATIKGMNMHIGVALSQDGKSWGRIEGDFPCGAVMVPYSATNKDLNAPNRDDDDSLLTLDEELYCAWPDVVMNSLTDAEKRKVGSKGSKPNFFMYYSTMTKDDRQKNIACAVSEDGFRWFKRGVCLRPSSENEEDGFDNGGCARCNVVRNASYDKDSKVWRNELGWTMYYEGISNTDNKHRIMVATSLDGRTWEKQGLILDVGSSDSDWDCGGVGSPHVIRMDDGTTRMYYTGQGEDGSTAIGVAKCISNDNAASAEGWAREQAQFTFAE